MGSQTTTVKNLGAVARINNYHPGPAELVSVKVAGPTPRPSYKSREFGGTQVFERHPHHSRGSITH